MWSLPIWQPTLTRQQTRVLIILDNGGANTSASLWLREFLNFYKRKCAFVTRFGREREESQCEGS